MTFTEDFNSASKTNSLGKDDAEDVAWFVIESVASAHDGVAGLVTVVHHLRNIYGLKDDGEQSIIPNPFFGANGHEGRSPGTRSYLTRRGYKNVGGSLLATVGEAASAVTVVDLVGIGQHGSASASTTMHMIKVRAVGSRFKRSETITRWVDAVIKAKAAKVAVRGTGLAAAAIPIPAVGLGVGIGTTVAKLGIKLTLGKLIARTSMELHWRAYQEQVISGGIGGSSTGAVGPASAIFTEIFNRRGATRIFGKYDIDRFIREPGGWMALNDKLMLI